MFYKIEQKLFITNYKFYWKGFHNTSFINLKHKVKPTSKHKKVKNLFISLLPFKIDKCAPINPPKNDPNSKTIKILNGNIPILLKAIAPVAFQKIPTEKKVILIAFKKSIPKVFIKRTVTSKPVPDDIEPFNMLITKTKITNLNQVTKLIFLFTVDKPKSGLLKE